LEITQEGMLLGIHTLFTIEEKGKKTVKVPRILKVPQQLKRSSGIAAQFLCDNSAYLLGIDSSGESPRTRKCFESAAELHEEILAECHVPAAEAVKAFFKTWNPDAAPQNKILQPYLEEISGLSLVFFFNDKFVLDDANIMEAWNVRQSQTNGPIMQCLVTGEKGPIARLHPNIKGVRGAQSSGASLVSFNAPAYESYGHDKEQGLNAPVSEYASFAYSTALNYLLSDKAHCQVIGDTTIIYWAEKNNDICQDAFADFLTNTNIIENADLKKFIEQLQQGVMLNYKDVSLDFNNSFYILGLSPNAARISVRFFLRSTFGHIMTHLVNHMKRMEIVKPVLETWDDVPLWALLQETVPVTSKDKAASPLLSGSVLKAILTDSLYPAALFQMIMLRIHSEQGNNKVNYRRAAIIKAYLNKNVFKRGYITVSLNEASTDTTYVLGRLFAVLEHIQQEANQGIKATIKDRYFDSACATPAIVFPVLLKLANHHLRKLELGKQIYFNKAIANLTGKLEGGTQTIPKHVPLDKQGEFILGYYHQTQKRFQKKEEK
jgi:CRISPR-associated protein Csd1